MSRQPSKCLQITVMTVPREHQPSTVSRIYICGVGDGAVQTDAIRQPSELFTVQALTNFASARTKISPHHSL